MSPNKNLEPDEDVNGEIIEGNDDSPRSNATHCERFDSLFLLLKSCTNIAPVAPEAANNLFFSARYSFAGIRTEIC